MTAARVLIADDHAMVRHARAGRASVTLSRTDHEVVLEIADDGRGLGPSTAAAGAGLRGMRERALLIGARLDVTDRRPGTAVRLVITQ
jgi:two-component system sensor histidine kinase UhpB